MTKYVGDPGTLKVHCNEVAEVIDQRNRSLLFHYVQIPLMAAVILASCTAFSQSNQLEVNSRNLEAAVQNDWMSYHGDLTGRRYSELKEITPDNVHQLELKWVFHSRNTKVLGAAPIVVAGVMYLPASNDLFAIDGLTGATLWRHNRQDALEEQDDESTHINRGIAVLSNQLYMETNDGHLLSLDARSGNVLWDVPFAEGSVGYGGVSAPLAIPGKVIVSATGSKGVPGGFVAAFDAAEGRELWRYKIRSNQVRNDPDSLIRPTGMRDASWMPGTYDPELNLVFEETNSQACDLDASAQAEEAPHGGCLLALDARTGNLKWQFPLPYEDKQTPAISAVPMLVDVPHRDAGSKQASHSKLLMAMQGNGFLTILDRESGTLVIERNLGKHPTFTGDSNSYRIGAAERLTGQEDFINACGSERESPSWNPPAYSEQAHRLYFLALEDCRDNAVRTKSGHPVQKVTSQSQAIGKSSLLVYDPSNDSWNWRDASAATDQVPSGITATASGLLLFGGRSRSFQVSEAITGDVLWSLPLGQSPTGPPITYSIGGKQYFAIAAGKDLFVFGLPCVTPCQQD